MPFLRPIVLITAVLSGNPAFAQQAAPESRGYAAVKAGSMHERAEDGLRQTSAALGIAGGLHLSPRWQLEVELAGNGVGSPEHRETLFSVTAIRLFREAGARPFLSAGVAAGRNQESLTYCVADRIPFGRGGDPAPTIVDCSAPDVRERVDETITSGSGFLHVGGGVRIPLGARLLLIPELRVHLAVTAVILRPTLGLAVTF